MRYEKKCVSKNSVNKTCSKNQYYKYLAQLLEAEPEMCLIYLRSSNLSTKDISEFIKYQKNENASQTQKNNQLLFNHFCRLGLLPLVKILMELDQNLNKLHGSILATLHGHYHVIKYIMKCEFDQSSTLIFVAFNSEQYDLVAKIISITNSSSQLNLVIKEACRQGHLFLVEKILESKSSYSYLRSSKNYLLAYQGGHYHITDYLERMAEENYYQDPSDSLYSEAKDETPQSLVLAQMRCSKDDLIKAMALNPNQHLLEETINKEAKLNIVKNQSVNGYLLRIAFNFILGYYLMMILVMLIYMFFSKVESPMGSEWNEKNYDIYKNKTSLTYF